MITPRLIDRLANDDFESLAITVADRLMVDVAPDALRNACRGFKPLERSIDGLQRADDTVVMWLKCRMDGAGMFATGGTADHYGRFSTEFNFCFLNIYESEEHLTNLRRVKELPKPQNPARSKIGKTHLKIQARNRTAGIVAPVEDLET